MCRNEACPPTTTSKPFLSSGYELENGIMSDKLLLFHSVSQELQRASTQSNDESSSARRPALPFEIVGIIARLADFILSAPHLKVSCDSQMRVISHRWSATRDLWFESSPLTRRTINKIASVHLTTVARHQGWTTHPHEGSWSWFELAILKPATPTSDARPEALQPNGIDWARSEPATLGDGHLGSDLTNRIKRRENGSMLTWESHRIPVDMNGEGLLTGMKFGWCDHELFDHIEEGDSIGVICCAQRRFWECVDTIGSLKFEVFFEPTPLT